MNNFNLPNKEYETNEEDYEDVNNILKILILTQYQFDFLEEEDIETTNKEIISDLEENENENNETSKKIIFLFIINLLKYLNKISKKL